MRWVQSDAFERMQDRLRQQGRLRMGRGAEPTAAVIDAQSTRSSPQGGGSGFDAGKKVKGRKRHMVVDTLGLLWAVTVAAASVQAPDRTCTDSCCRWGTGLSGAGVRVPLLARSRCRIRRRTLVALVFCLAVGVRSLLGLVVLCLRLG